MRGLRIMLWLSTWKNGMAKTGIERSSFSYMLNSGQTLAE